MTRRDADRRPLIGVALPTNRIRLSRDTLQGIVRSLDEAGCGSLWVNDHLGAFPAGNDHYPYSPTGHITWDPALPQYEALSTCAFLAAATDRMTVGTSVLVLPQRHPVEVAKTTATLSDLSDGRFRLGVGVGWSRREMRLLGWDPATRGQRIDEQLAVIRAAWGERRECSPGSHYEVPEDLIQEPKPLPGQRPPILIGGMAPAALRRVLRHGDGWLAVAGADDPSALRAADATLARLRRQTSGSVAGAVKISMAVPDPRLAVRALAELTARCWDDISFEFDRWDLDAACAVVAACLAHWEETHA